MCYLLLLKGFPGTPFRKRRGEAAHRRLSRRSFGAEIAKEVRDEKVELRRGSYLLFCSLPEHEAKGMKATLHVQ